MTRPYLDEGDVRLYLGDSLEVMPTLTARSIDLIVTDPPYVIGAVSAGNIGSKAGTWGDMMNSARWFRDWYEMARRLLKPTGAIWTCCNWRSLPVVMRAASDLSWPVASVLVWHKDWIGPGGPVGLRPSYELVALLPMPEFAIPDRGIPDVWTVPWASHKPTGHPAEKPVALMRKIIATSELGPGAIVLDPFMGSGSTIVAASEYGCGAIGIETEERYVNLAASRLGQLSLLGGAA